MKKTMSRLWATLLSCFIASFVIGVLAAPELGKLVPEEPVVVLLLTVGLLAAYFGYLARVHELRDMLRTRAGRTSSGRPCPEILVDLCTHIIGFYIVFSGILIVLIAIATRSCELRTLALYIMFFVALIMVLHTISAAATIRYVIYESGRSPRERLLRFVFDDTILTDDSWGRRKEGLRL